MTKMAEAGELNSPNQAPDIPASAEQLKPPFASIVAIEVWEFTDVQHGWISYKTDQSGQVVAGPDNEKFVYILPREAPATEALRRLGLPPSLHPLQYICGPFQQPDTDTWYCHVFSMLHPQTEHGPTSASR